MTTWFISRHAGALEWAGRRGIQAARQQAHLDLSHVNAGDIVIGTLPVHLAAAVCSKQARYFHLSLDLSEAERGKELSASDMEACGAHIAEYIVTQGADIENDI